MFHPSSKQQREGRQHFRRRIDRYEFDFTERSAAEPASYSLRRELQRLEPHAGKKRIEVAQPVLRSRRSPLVAPAAETAPHDRFVVPMLVRAADAVHDVARIAPDQASLVGSDGALPRVASHVAAEVTQDLPAQPGHAVIPPVGTLMILSVEAFLVRNLGGPGNIGQMQGKPPHSKVLISLRAYVGSFGLVGSPERLPVGASGSAGVCHEQGVVALVELRQPGVHSGFVGAADPDRREQHPWLHQRIGASGGICHASEVGDKVIVGSPHRTLTLGHTHAVVLGSRSVTPQEAVTLAPVMAHQVVADLPPDGTHPFRRGGSVGLKVEAVVAAEPRQFQGTLIAVSHSKHVQIAQLCLYEVANDLFPVSRHVGLVGRVFESDPHRIRFLLDGNYLFDKRLTTTRFRNEGDCRIAERCVRPEPDSMPATGQRRRYRGQRNKPIRDFDRHAVLVRAAVEHDLEFVPLLNPPRA